MSDQPAPSSPTHGDQPAATPPLELPVSGGTTPTQRSTQADHGSSLTLAQAAARSGLSVSTWRRRIKAGKAQGAYLAPSPVGDEWRIPVATVEAATAEGGRVSTATHGDPVETADLRARIAELEQQLAVQRALADERRATLDQVLETMRALGRGDDPKPAGATTVRVVNPSDPFALGASIGSEIAEARASRAPRDSSRRWWRRSNKAAGDTAQSDPNQ